MRSAQESRVVVVAPTGRDAHLVCEMLGRNGIACEPSPDVADACRKADEGLGAMVLAEEALNRPALDALSDIFNKQPNWSDIPLILLTSNTDRIHAAGRALLEQQGGRGRFVLVERPVRPLTLRSAVDAALQTRKRQYDLRDYLVERARSEERLRQSQKMESIGILAGGIAHDFNNLLTGVLGNASLAFEAVGPGSPVRPMLKDVIEATERAAHLTRQLLAYAGKGKFVVEPLDLSKQVRDISTLIQPSIPKWVQLRLETTDTLPLIDADAAQIQQVIMNLVINAAEAIPESRSGTVMVTTSARTLDDAAVRANFPDASIGPGNYVTLEVIDNGVGMTEETMSHIFDPFFTTKFTGRGLGLAAVLGIVRGHKGALKISSTIGQGTSFMVVFPAAEEHPAPQNGRSATGTFALSGAGVVLVIDDEDIVRRTAKTMLERFGYTVVACDDGQRGVDLFRTIADRVGVVLLDMSMPQMSGEETFRRLRAIRPDVKVILSSGYNEVEAVRRFTGKGLAGFIQKPYTSARLAEKIKSVLAEKK